jgi:predicted dehydrogenase
MVITTLGASGAGGSLQVSGGSFLGSGHRIELYGEDGTLVLSNPTADYFRGFQLTFARQGDGALKPIATDDADEEPFSDSRSAPVRRLVRRLIDACERSYCPSPSVAEGYRVQCLIDAARRAHLTGRWIDVAPPGGRGCS